MHSDRPLIYWALVSLEKVIHRLSTGNYGVFPQGYPQVDLKVNCHTLKLYKTQSMQRGKYVDVGSGFFR